MLAFVAMASSTAACFFGFADAEVAEDDAAGLRAGDHVFENLESLSERKCFCGLVQGVNNLEDFFGEVSAEGEIFADSFC